MKKFLNKLSSSGKIDVDSLREDPAYSDEEVMRVEYREIWLSNMSIATRYAHKEANSFTSRCT
jgi:hypothetical protein